MKIVKKRIHVLCNQFKGVCKFRRAQLKWVAPLIAALLSSVGYGNVILNENIDVALSYVVLGGLIVLFSLKEYGIGAIILISIFFALVGSFFGNFLMYLGITVVYAYCLKPFLDLSKSKPRV